VLVAVIAAGYLAATQSRERGADLYQG
jgi:hypothetical protein